MEPEGSSPYTQKPATCPYPEPDQSSLPPQPNLLKIHFNLRLGIPSGLPSGFPTKALFSWEANRSSASHEILRILWNTRVHYRIHKSLILSFLQQNQQHFLLLKSGANCLYLPDSSLSI